MNNGQIRGWRIVGSSQWWPAMLGPHPQIPGVRWVPIYYAAKSEDRRRSRE